MRALALALLLASTALAANDLTRQEKKDGWRLLFDGRTLDGWQGRSTFDKTTTGDWKVENGALVCGGTAPSWISTNDSFSDYRLMLEFRGPEKVNSGVFLRSQPEGQPHVTGYELQIWDYQPAGYLTGSLVGSVKADPVKILPDQWNKFDITANGDHFVVLLNGKKILDAQDSKHSSGLIGFQCQKDQRIEFRNIRVQPIKK
ncbi:MAG TPA: DUF1080 domain-containing protein [Bryobacteraceae bacterium]|nr:DUF1080 domain-containing protein [Bryobacteraceae bacterium]